MPLVERAALLPFSSQVLTYGSGFHFSHGGPTVLTKSCFSALFVVIAFLLSVIMLFIALNPRSHSALLGERMSVATINLFSWSGMLLPPLTLNSIYARWVCCLLRRSVPQTFHFIFSKTRIFLINLFWILRVNLTNKGFVVLSSSCMNATLCSAWCRRKEPFFHIVSYSPNKLSLNYYWASSFSQFYLLEWHCFFCSLSQDGMFSRGSDKAFIRFV